MRGAETLGFYQARAYPLCRYVTGFCFFADDFAPGIAGSEVETGPEAPDR